MAYGWRYWPFIFVGGIAGEMGGGHTFFMAMLLAAGSTLSFVVAARLLDRYTKFSTQFETVRDYGQLLIIGLIAAALSSTINTRFLIWGSLISPDNLMPIYQKWFIGDFFGLVFITPIILVFHQAWVRTWSKQKIGWFVLSLAAAFLFGQGVFFGWFKEYFDLTGRGFFIIFTAAVFGFYFGRHGALALFGMTMVQAILSVLHGGGYFGGDLLSRPGQQYIWFYLGIICVIGVLVSLTVKNFKKQTQALKEASWIAVEAAIHFKAIVSSVPILMATYDLKSEKTDYVNPFFTKVLGYTQEDFSGPGGWWDLAYPDAEYRAKVQAEWNRRVEHSATFSTPFEVYETNTTGKNGGQHYIGWGCFPVDQKLVIYGQDLTEKRKTGKVLEMASTIYQAMGESMVICDAKNNIVLANETFQNQTGYSNDDLSGLAFADFLVKRHGARSYSDIFTSLEAMGRWEGQAWIRVKTAEELLKFVSIYSTFDQEGLVLQRVALISEVTDQRKARELINQQANFDPLTGLPNRRLMFDRLEQLVKQATRSQKNLAVIYIDLDNFKDTNDSRGHDFGDELLKSVAMRLRAEIRGTDTVARIGGDEFVVLLGELDRPENADQIIRGILNKLTEPFVIQDHTIFATASLGISIFPNDGLDSKTLLLGADQAMYAAKANGRNNYQYFTQSLQVEASNRANIISELRSALEKKQFFLEYQPILSLETGAITHAEALLRWRRDNGEVVMPATFIQIAEESGLIVEIGDCALGELLAYMKSLDGPGQQVSFALNVSASQFNSSKHSAAEWLRLIGESGISPELLVIEITERMMLIQSQRVLRKIAMFQEFGCKFSVDDFGTGYSSLASLKNFNFDYIKIDSHFIKTLIPGSMDTPLVSAMVAMAKGLGLYSVAEGVENQVQADILKEMGCDFAQGYLYSKPISAQEFRNLLT